MNTFVLMGGCHIIMAQVLMALYSAGRGRCIILGGPDTKYLRHSFLCHQYIGINYENPDDTVLANHIDRITSSYPDAVLLPIDCTSVRMLNRIRDQVRINIIALPDVETMDMFDDKWRFYLYCRQHGLSVPDTIYIGGKSDLEFQEVANTLGTPFILKPINKAGSEGVHIIHTEEHYRSAIINNDSYQFDALIAQRYIQGRDVCIDLYAINGNVLALAFQQRVGGAIRFFQNDQMVQIAHRLVGHSGYNGVMNLDARIEDSTGKVYLLESNPRFWASLTASVGAGLNFVSEILKPSDMKSPVQMLTQGIFHMRHPLISPASWSFLLFDKSGHGRLLRAKMHDWHAIGELMHSFASRPFRLLPRLLRKKQADSSSYVIQHR